MDSEEKEIKVDEEFLFKYGKLFHTFRFDKFYNRLEQINQSITKKYNEKISIFFYISDENNNMKCAYEEVYNTANNKEKDCFKNKIQNLYEKEYLYTTNKNIQKLSISYAIVPHNIDENNINYYKIKILNKYFSNLYYKFEGNVFSNYWKNKIGQILKPLKNHIPLSLSLISVVVLSLVLIRLNAIPMQTLDLNILSISITITLITIVFAFIIISLIIFLLFAILNKTFLFIFTKKAYMNNKVVRQFNILLETIDFSIIIIPLFIMLILPLSSIKYFSDGKFFFIDDVIKQYILSTQVPSILKIKYHISEDDLNSTYNILYLGNDDTFNFFFDIDINYIISKNEHLYKKICMGKETGYIDDLLPLIYESDINNKVHRKAMKRDITILPNHIDFKEAFCYVNYPKIIKLTTKDKNETVLWMGLNVDYAKDKNTSYYYSELQIRNIIEHNNTLQKNLNNNELWIHDMMQTEVLRELKYNIIDNANFTEIKDLNLSKEFL